MYTRINAYTSATSDIPINPHTHTHTQNGSHITSLGRQSKYDRANADSKKKKKDHPSTNNNLLHKVSPLSDESIYKDILDVPVDMLNTIINTSEDIQFDSHKIYVTLKKGARKTVTLKIENTAARPVYAILRAEVDLNSFKQVLKTQHTRRLVQDQDINIPERYNSLNVGFDTPEAISSAEEHLQRTKSCLDESWLLEQRIMNELSIHSHTHTHTHTATHTPTPLHTHTRHTHTHTNTVSATEKQLFGVPVPTHTYTKTYPELTHTPEEPLNMFVVDVDVLLKNNTFFHADKVIIGWRCDVEDMQVSKKEMTHTHTYTHTSRMLKLKRDTEDIAMLKKQKKVNKEKKDLDTRTYTHAYTGRVPVHARDIPTGARDIPAHTQTHTHNTQTHTRDIPTYKALHKNKNIRNTRSYKTQTYARRKGRRRAADSAKRRRVQSHMRKFDFKNTHTHTNTYEKEDDVIHSVVKIQNLMRNVPNELKQEMEMFGTHTQTEDMKKGDIQKASTQFSIQAQAVDTHTLTDLTDTHTHTQNSGTHTYDSSNDTQRMGIQNKACGLDLVTLTPFEKDKKYMHMSKKEIDHMQIQQLKAFVESFSHPNYTEQILFLAPDVPISKSDEPPSDLVPNDPLFSRQWNLDACVGEKQRDIAAYFKTHTSCDLNEDKRLDMDMLNAWSIFRRDEDAEVIVAVIDTGVNYAHPDLRDSMWINTAEKEGLPGVDDDDNGYVDDIYGWNFIDDTNNALDDNGHGSHVAGIIAARGNNRMGITGISPNAKIMALKVLDAKGNGDVSRAIPAIHYALKNGAQILTNSWGGVPGYSGMLLAMMLKQAVSDASDTVFVVAAGNDGKDITSAPFYPASLVNDWSLTVTSFGPEGLISNFANYGVKNVHLAAPGENITSLWTGKSYRMSSGTSMAAPSVSGLAAMLIVQNPLLSSQQIVDIIIQSVTNDLSLRHKTITGGRLNAHKAMALADAYFFGLSKNEIHFSGPFSKGVTVDVQFDASWLPVGEYKGVIEVRWSRQLSVLQTSKARRKIPVTMKVV